MIESKITEEIVLLMRGFFSTPVISSLGRLGVLNAMISATSFTVDDFLNIPNKKLLQDSFHYFLRLGFIEHVDNQEDIFKVTELGRQIFHRCSSFYVPHSYYEYMNKYYEQLLNPFGKISQKVERLENVIGSGKTHQRYFPPAISFLKRKVNFNVIVDIGCGDGHFLSVFLKNISKKKVVGIDISQIAIDVTYRNLHAQYPNQEISVICSDAFDIEKWSKELFRIAGTERIAISMWFLIHEISKNKPDIVIKYLKQIHKIFPDAPIIICELVRHRDDILAKNRTVSIMAEYLFFHELSGQGILSWEEYQKILNNIPYKLLSERLFDEIPDGKRKFVPSSFVWCLVPK